MSSSARYLERDFFELGTTTQSLLERAHSFWFKERDLDAEHERVPPVFENLVLETLAGVHNFLTKGLGQEVVQLLHKADAALSKAAKNYRQQWFGDKHRKIVNAVALSESGLSTKMEKKFSPLAAVGWKSFRAIFHDLIAALPKQFSKWVDLGSLTAQVLVLAENEQPAILGVKSPFQALREKLRDLRDTDAMFSDLDVELSNPRSNRQGYPDLKLVQRQVEAICRAILDRLAGAGSDAAKSSRSQDHSAWPASATTTGDADVEGTCEPELACKLIPPTQVSWLGGEPRDLTPMQWLLLERCLENRTTEIQDVTDHVWKRTSSEVSDGALSTLIHRLNERLARFGIPISLSQGWLRDSRH